MKTFKFSLVLRTRENTDDFITLDDNIYGIHSQRVNILYLVVQSNLNSSNTHGSFTMANSNSFLSALEILPIAQENKYLRNFSYFIMKLYVVCTQ